jgi:cellulose synthase/poly-beta-1,6-N-acetylglucosamine synthase-like glycosyltransferase
VAERREPTRGLVAVLVPAHNEEAGIAATIEGLLAQTWPRVAVLVISDNSTDRTVEIARAYGEHVSVVETRGNTGKKGGAMEFGVELLERLPAGDIFPEFVMTMDADSWVDRHFIERAVRTLWHDERLGATTGAVLGKPGIGTNWWQRLLCWAQEVELAQYQSGRVVHRVFTLSGAGAVYRTEALLAIRDVNGGKIFKAGSRVEDFVTTLHLKELGWRVTSNEHCRCWTDVMPTPRTLIRQRVSWQLGSMGELVDMGWRRFTAGNVARMAWVSVIQVVWAALLGLTIADALRGELHPTASTASFYAVLGVYNAYRARVLGWKTALVCGTNIPMVLYWPFICTWVYVSLFKLARGQRATW